MLRSTIYVYDNDTGEFEPRGTFVLEPGGQVEIEPGLPPEGEAWMRDVMTNPPRIKALDENDNVGEWVTVTSDPEGWIRGLRAQYNGMLMRADLEDDEKDEDEDEE